MNAQRIHHVDLNVAVKQDVKSIQPPAQCRRNERALLCRRDLRNRWSVVAAMGRGDFSSLSYKIYHGGTEARRKGFF